jgi:HEAT repeat protein
MRRPPTAVVVLLTGLLVTLAPLGCGRKAKSDRQDAAEAAPDASRPPVTPKPNPQPNDGNPPPGGDMVVPSPLGDGMIPPVPMPGMNPPPPVPMNPPPKDPVVPPKDPVTPPVGVQPVKDPMLPPPPKEPKKDDPAPMMGSLPKEPEWPREIDGRDAKAYVKDIYDPDPSIRVIALRTLPNFGPTVKKATTPDGKTTIGKALVSRMNHLVEKDPGVRLAAYAAASAIGFEDEGDIKEAIRLLAITVDQSLPGSQSRLQAIQTLATIGPKAEFAVPQIVGQNVASDPSFETRRSLASTLGLIGADEKTGPNVRALHCLTTYLIKDESAAVRLEAMQALVVLGPPVHKVPVPDPKTPGKTIDVFATDAKAAEPFVKLLKARLVPLKKTVESNATGLVEPNRQVEIWARVAVMRFDAAEINAENLDGIAKYVHGSDYGAKIQALAALGMLGETGARRIDEVVKALASDDASVVFSAVSALVSMGPAAKPAIPELEKLKARGKTEDEKKYFKMLSDESIKAIKDSDKPRDKK